LRQISVVQYGAAHTQGGELRFTFKDVSLCLRERASCRLGRYRDLYVTADKKDHFAGKRGDRLAVLP
jgi:hypothetical protein